MEGLHADLRPELHRTETMKRLKQEKDDLQNEIGEAVRKFKA